MRLGRCSYYSRAPRSVSTFSHLQRGRGLLLAAAHALLPPAHSRGAAGGARAARRTRTHTSARTHVHSRVHTHSDTNRHAYALRGAPLRCRRSGRGRARASLGSTAVSASALSTRPYAPMHRRRTQRAASNRRLAQACRPPHATARRRRTNLPLPLLGVEYPDYLTLSTPRVPVAP